MIHLWANIGVPEGFVDGNLANNTATADIRVVEKPTPAPAKSPEPKQNPDQPDNMPEPKELGGYMGFPMLFSFDSFGKQYQITLQGALSHTVTLGTDIHGNIARLNNALSEMPKKLEYCREQLKMLRQQMETAKAQLEVPFDKEQELQTKSERLAELNILLNIDKPENEVLEGEPDEDMNVPEKNAVGYER